MENGMVAGQLSLFDMPGFIPEPPTLIAEPPVRINEGQCVWVVKRGEVKEYRATGETWVIESKPDERFYRLITPFHTFNVVCNNRIGNDVFLTVEEAEKLASENMKKYQVILKESFHPVLMRVWTYIRDIDTRQMYAWYAVMPDGMVYIKKFMTYHHILIFKSVDNAIKKMEKEFFKQQEFTYCHPQELEHPEKVITFKNMYKCRDADSWDYAETDYGGCL